MMNDETQNQDGENQDDQTGDNVTGAGDSDPPESNSKGGGDVSGSAAVAGDDLNWRDSIADEHKATADRFTDLNAAMKSVEDLRKLVSERVAMPGEDADDDTWSKFRDKMGIPEAAESYALPDDFETDDVGEALIEAFRPIAHEANLSQDGFQKIIQTWNEFTDQAIAQEKAERQKQTEESVAALQKEWGKDYEANLNLALRAFKQMGGDEVAQFFDTTKTEDGMMLGNHPVMIKMGAQIGRQMSEDGMIAPVGAAEAQTIAERINALSSEIHAANAKGDAITRNRLVQERSELVERLDGSKPVVGEEGRVS